jgi:hypothetical protein
MVGNLDTCMCRGTDGALTRLAARLQVSDRRPAPRITSNVKHNLRVLKFWKVQGFSLPHQSLLSVSIAELNRENMW